MRKSYARQRASGQGRIEEAEQKKRKKTNAKKQKRGEKKTHIFMQNVGEVL